MLIKQHQLFGEAVAFLDKLNERLPFDESVYSAHQVNVRHNQRLGQDLVQLESFLGFAQANGIDDAGFALHKVCEANEVPRDSLAFLAQEENLLADDELLETFEQIRESGFPVYVARISDASPYWTKLNEALALDEDCEDYFSSSNLIQYVNEGVLDDARAKMNSGINTIKSKTSAGSKVIASKLASVRKAIAQKTNEMAKAAAPAKAAIKRQIDKLKVAASELKSKLVSAKDAVGNKISAAGNAISDTASNVKNKLSGGADSVKSMLSNASGKVTAAKNSMLDSVGKVKAKFA